MRRFLRKISAGETSNMGDTSTLLDADGAQHIIQGQKGLEIKELPGNNHARQSFVEVNYSKEVAEQAKAKSFALFHHDPEHGDVPI